MPFYEREAQILNILQKKSSVTMHELEEWLFVSPSTLRRDLARLEEKGLVTRTHGGAMLVKNSAEDKISFLLRENVNSAEKEIIAKRAVTFINNEDKIFLDATTSAYSIVQYLVNFEDITVVTNSARTSMALGELNISNICTGGKMVNKSFSYIGGEARRMVLNYNADILFFSCRGLSLDGRLTSNSIEENEIRRAMMSHAAKKIFLCDSTKIGKMSLHTLCTVADVDEIICDKPLPDEIVKLLEKRKSQKRTEKQ